MVQFVSRMHPRLDDRLQGTKNKYKYRITTKRNSTFVAVYSKTNRIRGVVHAATPVNTGENDRVTEMNRMALVWVGLIFGGLFAQNCLADDSYNYYPDFQQSQNAYGEYSNFRWRPDFESYDANGYYMPSYQDNNVLPDGDQYVNSLPQGVYRPLEGEFRPQTQMGRYRFRDDTSTHQNQPSNDRYAEQNSYFYDGRQRFKFREDDTRSAYRPSSTAYYSPFRPDREFSSKAERYNQPVPNYRYDDYFSPQMDYDRFPVFTQDY